MVSLDKSNLRTGWGFLHASSHQNVTTGRPTSPKDVKNEGRSGNVYENKGSHDKLPGVISGISAWLSAIFAGSYTNRRPYFTAKGNKTDFGDQNRRFPHKSFGGRIQALGRGRIDENCLRIDQKSALRWAVRTSLAGKLEDSRTDV